MSQTFWPNFLRLIWVIKIWNMRSVKTCILKMWCLEVRHHKHTYIQSYTCHMAVIETNSCPLIQFLQTVSLTSETTYCIKRRRGFIKCGVITCRDVNTVTRSDSSPCPFSFSYISMLEHVNHIHIYLWITWSSVRVL